MKKQNAAIGFILTTILIDVLGIGLIIPVLPDLVTQMSGGDVSDGSTYYGWMVAAYALMQFLFSPLLGTLSDSFGRRPVILFSLLGTGLDYILMTFAPDLTWLFVGRIVSGITGASITAANAYIADISTSENRARNFGLVGASFGLGFIVGPAVGGLLGEYHLRAPFVAAAILCFANFLYGYFIVPESHVAEKRRRFSLQRTNPFTALTRLRTFPLVLGIVGIIFLERLAHSSLPSTWVLFTKYRFQWSNWENGLSLALVGLMFAIVQGGLTGAVVRRIGERRAIVFGLGVGATCFLMYGLATQGWMMYCIIVVSSLGGVAGPSLQSLVSKSVSQDEQGLLQGAIASVNSIASFIGPILHTSLFAFFTNDASRERLREIVGRSVTDPLYRTFAPASLPDQIPSAAFLLSFLLIAIAALWAGYRLLLRKEAPHVTDQATST